MKQQKSGVKKSQESEHISEKLWHKLLRPDYVIANVMFQLSADQVTQLISLNSAQQLHSVINHSQSQAIALALSNSPSKALYPKINGRTPKDLPLINRQIRKPSDFVQVLHTSEYVLEGLHSGQPADVLLRHFVPQLIGNQKVYQVTARGGFVIGIAQKFCDHVQQPPSASQLQKIFDIVQQIMAPITMVTSKNHELNSFIACLHLSPSPKITSISPYPCSQTSQHKSEPSPQHQHQHFSLIPLQQLQTYYSQISSHKSSSQQYQLNQGVIPLIRTIIKAEDVKHYDMGEYLMGNQMDDHHKLEEWKQFIKEAQGKINIKKQEQGKDL